MYQTLDGVGSDDSSFDSNVHGQCRMAAPVSKPLCRIVRRGQTLATARHQALAAFNPSVLDSTPRGPAFKQIRQLYRASPPTSVDGGGQGAFPVFAFCFQAPRSLSFTGSSP